jgi:hypothetical protein
MYFVFDFSTNFQEYISVIIEENLNIMTAVEAKTFAQVKSF